MQEEERSSGLFAAGTRFGSGRKRKARLNSGLGAKELHATARDKYLGEGRVKVWKGIKLRNKTRAVFSGLADSIPIFLKLLLSENSFRVHASMQLMALYTLQEQKVGWLEVRYVIKLDLFAAFPSTLLLCDDLHSKSL